jgi:hypothetical protein
MKKMAKNDVEMLYLLLSENRELAGSRNRLNFLLSFFALILERFWESSKSTVSCSELAGSDFGTLEFMKPADLWKHRKRELTVNWEFCVWEV